MTLVLRALGVGDLATGVPALRALRRAYPDSPLWLAAPRWLAPLVALVGAVDRLLPVEELAPVRWPPQVTGRVAVNLHGRGPQSHRLLATAAPTRMLAFACPEAGFDLGPRWRADEHEVHRWCRLLHWYGLPADPTDLRLPEPAPSATGGTVARGLTVVHPGAKSPARRWPADRYAAVARALAAGGHRVVVTGSASERRLAHEVASRAGLPGTAVLAGRTGLAELAALVASARLVVCGDTGVAHLATAYGTRSVVLFGPTPPWWWGPPQQRWDRHRVLWREEVWRRYADRPDGAGGAALTGGAGGVDAPAQDDRPHPALAAVTVEEVLEAAARAD